MSVATTSTHPDHDALLDYWLGDSDAAATDAIDEHLLRCDACGAAFDELVSLSRGVRDAFAQGAVRSVLASAFVERLKAAGRHVREYRVPRNGSVLCSVEPDDDLVVSRLDAPLHGVERLDAVVAHSMDPAHAERLHDIPFDAATAEVLFVPEMRKLRSAPSHDFVVKLLAVDAAGEREIGHYTFHHQAATTR
jgi:hypothetical protein